MLTVKAELRGSKYIIPPTLCTVRKVVELDGAKYDSFAGNLQKDYDFIRENASLMGFGEGRSASCLLVVGKDKPDGILVMSEGTGYAKHTAVLPDAVALLAAQAQNKTPTLKLKDLLAVNLEDVHLTHRDVDAMPYTIVKLNASTLTDEGKAEWADVLNADVRRIFHGIFGLQLELSGVSQERIEGFSLMLAGYCSMEDSERWLTEERDEAAQKSMAAENLTSKHISFIVKGDVVSINGCTIVATGDAYMTNTPNGREWNFESGGD